MPSVTAPKPDARSERSRRARSIAMSGIVAPDVRVQDTGSARGRGVFAERGFRAGELVETSPVVVIETAFEQLPLDLQRMLFSWPGSGNPGGVHALALGYGRLYNGANPACLRFVRDAAAGVIRFFAARDIAEGEELTINYSAADGAPATLADEWFAEHEIRCLPQ
jgi:hypothetical protein